LDTSNTKNKLKLNRIEIELLFGEFIPINCLNSLLGQEVSFVWQKVGYLLRPIDFDSSLNLLGIVILTSE
jgi:hypothetical protein